jgi:preprotein translocase subunit SecE
MANKNEAKKPNIFVRMGRKIKEVFSELKRVTWPTFPKVVKTTCVVLVIVLVFTLIVTGINQGLQALLDLITGLGE